MSLPRLLDLFCGAGGAAMGYARAGFEVVGVDLHPQPRYPFEFHQADALTFVSAGPFDAVHASPPCQAHSSMRTMPDARPHLDLIPAMRERLRLSNLPYIIENVVGAPLLNPITLCGTMFNLGYEDAELRRHRLFESNIPLQGLRCVHGQRTEVVGVYGGHLRNRKRRTIGVYGEGVRDSRRKGDRGVADFSVVHGRVAMGIDWMTLAELCQSIPPAYTEYLGRQLLAHLQSREAVA